MYVVKKKIKGKEYYYLNKSVREGNRVISKNVAYLGKDKEESEKKAKEIIGKIENEKNNKNIGEIKSEEKMETKVKDKNIEGKAGLTLTIEELANFFAEIS